MLRFYDSATNLVDLAKKTTDNAICIARIVHSLQILPLTKQLTNLAGNTWNGSLQNKRAERNEMLLCHEFHRAKFVVPDRENAMSKKRRLQSDANTANFDNADEADQPSGQSGPRRQKAAYSGGLVLEPKVGLYDEYVMLLDFNSLYPSIIQEHNICFTTVDRPDENEVQKLTSEVELLAHTSLPDGTVDDGILPKVLRRLVNSRQQVKTAMKSERNAKNHQNLDIRQKALKLTANSMYGCLGFQNSRFYAKPLAALITAKGREALQSTIAVVTQELSLDVVYGDTDSVFVNTKTTDFNDAMQAAQQIKRSVNKRYKKLEIEIDGVFGRLLLLKKKKYAGLKVVDQAKGIYEREYKGLDIVRRDWCGLAKGMGETILDQVLSCDGKEEAVNWIHNFITEQCAEMDAGKVAIEKFVITKGLTKAPQDYPDAKNQAHVQVALRLTARGKAIRAGQEVEYVICEPSATDGPKESFASRARHVSEFALDPTLKVDVAWYKSQQVHPLVSRLLGPVEGTDAARIAECLGMDGAKFAQSVVAKAASGGDDGVDADLGAMAAVVDALLDRSKRFKTFKSSLPGLSCKSCSQEVSWKQMLQPEVGEATGTNALFRCGHCGSEMQPVQAQNLMAMQLRSLLRSHSECWVQCTEEAGLAKTRREKSGRNLTSERQVLQEF
jgi:DNA polymerase alpha subunit A